MSHSRVTSRQLSLVAVWLCVVGSGFGVMSVMWLAGSWPADLPGWGDYRAAVVGDGLLVPTLVVSVLVAGDWLPATPRDRLAVVTGGALGAVAGAFVQYAWLSDDAPHLNWAMLEVHRFTVPGWYHAVFLTAMTALLGALSMRLAVRSRVAGKVPLPTTIAVCALGFAVLQTTDAVLPAGYAVRPEQSPGGIVSAAMTVVAVLAALAVLTPRGGRAAREHLVGVAYGVLGGVAVGLVCAPWPEATGPAMLVTGVVTALAVWQDLRSLGGSAQQKGTDKFSVELVGDGVPGSSP